MNTRQLLEQDVLWLTADRMPMRLVDMDPSHRRNTLAFLRRRAEYLASAYDWCEFYGIFKDAPDEVFDAWERKREAELTDGAEAWLERRPLVRELNRLVELDGYPDVVDGEIVQHEIESRQELPA